MVSGSTPANDWMKSAAAAAVVIVGMVILGLIALLRDGSVATDIVSTLDQLITWGMIALVGMRLGDVAGNVLLGRSQAQITIAQTTAPTPAPVAAPQPQQTAPAAREA